MDKLRRFFWLVVFVSAVCLLSPSVGRAAEPLPVFVSLTLPAGAVAGETLHAVVVAREPAAGVQSARLSLRGPVGQVLVGVLVHRPGTDELVLDLPLSPLLVPGRWVVSELRIESNNGYITTLKAGDAAHPFDYGITVANPGQTDSQPGYVQALAITPAKVEPGGKLSIAAQIPAPAAGIRTASAMVRNAAPDQVSSYADRVRLLYNAATGRWEGTTLAPILPDSAPESTLWLGWITVTTQTGVSKEYICWPYRDPLPRPCTFQVTPQAQVRPGLITPATLDLFYPGQPDFFTWAGQDAAYLLSLLPRLEHDPQLVQGLIGAQLPALSRALTTVRKEIYQDPLTGVTIAPPNTSGKQLALAAALRGRLLLWGEIDRRRAGASSLPLTEAELRAALVLLTEYDAKPVDLRQWEQAGPLYAQRMLETIISSRTPAAVWSQPMVHNNLFLADANLHPHVIWVVPFSSGEASGWHSDYRLSQEMIITLPATLPAQPAFHTPVHELGHHFHDTYLQGIYADRNPRWNEYLALRGGQTWYTGDQIGHNGRPWENFAEDFSRTFLDPDLAPQLDFAYMYPDLEEDAATQAKFRQFVLDLAKTPPQPIPTLLSPMESLTVAGPGSYLLQGRGVPGQALDIWSGPLTLAHIRSDGQDRDRYLTTVTTDANGTWQFKLPETGSLQAVGLNAWQERVNYFHAYAAIYRSALLLDHLPIATSAGRLLVTGSTDPGATVTLGEQRTTAAGDGRFTLALALAPGVNRLTVVASRPDGSRTTAVHEVTAAGNDFPLSVDAPVLADPGQVSIAGQTQPGATVAAGEQRTRADASGAYRLVVALPAGDSPLAVTATLDGQSAHWQGRVLVGAS